MSESEDPASGPVLVLTTVELELLAVVRSLLESADIPFIVQGDHALAQLPTGVMAGPFARSGMAARVFVPATRAAEARDLLANTLEPGEEPN